MKKISWTTKNIYLLVLFIFFTFCGFMGCQENSAPIIQIPIKPLSAIKEKESMLITYPEVKEGMVVGEVGAGTGRYTFQIAEKVSNSGFVYANDIDIKALKVIEKKCKKENIKNIKTIIGKEKDPCFPVKNLDMVFVLATLHHLKYEEEMLKNISQYLKKAGLLVIMEMPTPFNASSMKQREWTDIKKVKDDCEKAGYELLKCDPFDFGRSYLYIFTKP
jgi:ubiquinone/menaquinone biosynthesis C-methylase UbiE